MSPLRCGHFAKLHSHSQHYPSTALSRFLWNYIHRPKNVLIRRGLSLCMCHERLRSWAGPVRDESGRRMEACDRFNKRHVAQRWDLHVVGVMPRGSEKLSMVPQIAKANNIFHHVVDADDKVMFQPECILSFILMP